MGILNRRKVKDVIELRISAGVTARFKLSIRPVGILLTSSPSGMSQRLSPSTPCERLRQAGAVSTLLPILPVADLENHAQEGSNQRHSDLVRVDSSARRKRLRLSELIPVYCTYHKVIN